MKKIIGEGARIGVPQKGEQRPGLLSGVVGLSVSEIAASADIVSFPTAPAVDPRTGTRYDRPTVRLIASVPVKTPGFAVLLLPAVTTITIHAASSPR